jgi:hypothetical protein
MLRELMITGAEMLKSCVSYTQSEVACMSAEEYRTTVLVPMGMGNRRG